MAWSPITLDKLFPAWKSPRRHALRAGGKIVTLVRMRVLAGMFDEWKPVSRVAGISWLVCYLLFLLYAFVNRPHFLFVDFVNLIVHEGGHFFFSWFGQTIMVLGGTLGELLVPMLCGIYFFSQREATATAFCSFWFFENFLYIGTYMADARAQELPLVGGGEHDWGTLFGQWGWLAQDQYIGAATRVVGWSGMFATMAWLAWCTWQDSRPDLHHLPERH